MSAQKRTTAAGPSESTRVVSSRVRVDLAALDALTTADVAVFCFTDARPLAGAAGFLDWRLCGALSQALVDQAFLGEEGEAMLLPCRGRLKVRRVFAFGLGPSENASVSTFMTACRTARDVLGRAGASAPVLLAPALRRRSDVEDTFVKAAASVFGEDVTVLAQAERLSP